MREGDGGRPGKLQRDEVNPFRGLARAEKGRKDEVNVRGRSFKARVNGGRRLRARFRPRSDEIELGAGRWRWTARAIGVWEAGV